MDENSPDLSLPLVAADRLVIVTMSECELKVRTPSAVGTYFVPRRILRTWRMAGWTASWLLCPTIFTPVTDRYRTLHGGLIAIIILDPHLEPLVAVLLGPLSGQSHGASYST